MTPLTQGLEERDRGDQVFEAGEGFDVWEVLQSWLEDEEGKECEWPLGAESSPWLMINPEMGFSALQLQGTEFCYHHRSLKEAPEVQKEMQLSWHLDFNLVKP